MTTDPQLAPTDTEIDAVAQEYLLRMFGSRVVFNEAMIDYARAVLAKWGQPAHSGEPVAFIHWPINGPPRLAWYSQKALNDAILKAYEGHQADVKLYTAPQPVEREPLTRERVKAICAESGYETATLQERADFINGIRHAERHHGIKGKEAGNVV